MANVEIEVKFYLADVEDIRQRIISLGAVSEGRVFEANIRFEDSEKSLIRHNSLLRLRKDKRVRLTFKSAMPKKDEQFKVYQETEVEVSDFDAMKSILESLGFYPEQVYEKWRETFILNDTQLCIDTMPFGVFLEIEGKKEDITALSLQLGLKWENRIVLTYLQIFSMIRQQMSLSFSDLTFEAFSGIKIDMSEYLHFFEAGGTASTS